MSDQHRTSPAADVEPDAPRSSVRPAAGVVGSGLLLAGVALAAANMRPAVTSLASVLGEVRDSLGASSTWASVLTSVPTLCFGLAGIGAPLLARRIGSNRVVGVALAVLTAALLVRAAGGAAGVLAGTVLVCAAIAMCNVLIPVVVKEHFPRRIGLATSLYTTAMAAGGSTASALTPWLSAVVGGWRPALAMWAVLALAALCCWVPGSRGAGARSAAQPAAVRATADGSTRSLLRSPLAWAVTAFFATQSLVAYVVMGWLPEVLRGAGMDATSAGALLGLTLVVGVPINLVLPPLVARTRSQSGWAAGMVLLTAIAVLGLLLAPLAAPVLWSIVLGIGMSAFPLALVLISLRTTNAGDTSRLSAMAQSLGYLIASAGPLLFGVLHELTGAWTSSLGALLGVLAVQAVAGVLAGRPRTL